MDGASREPRARPFDQVPFRVVEGVAGQPGQVHCAGRSQSEFPFYDSDELKDWARSAYSEAVANGTMDKLDVVLPKTVSASDIIPASFSETEYAHACAKRMERANEAFLSAFRDVSDLNAAAAAVGGTGSGVSEGQSL